MQLSELKPNQQNPRFIKDTRFKALVKSLREFPQMMELRPFVVDDTGMILGGNMRYNALKELKHTEIPDTWVKRASELTEDQKRRFIIADNLPFGEWDMDVLANEWDAHDLEEWGMDDIGNIAYDKMPDEVDGDDEKELNKCPKCGHVW